MNPTPIACAEAVRRLWAFLDGELDATDHQAVEVHLAWCRTCCGELAFARELQRLLRTRTGAELPGDVQARLERCIDDLVVPADDGGSP